MGKYIGFWQAVVQTRIWLPIKNAATVHPHTYVIMVPHFCLSVSNSTAYWLHCINSYITTTTVFYVTPQQRDRLPVGQHIWRQSWWKLVWTIHTDHCLDTLCWSDSTADEAYKIATMRYFATAKLELTDTVAI